ncbi:MAG: hypothetical protein KY469_03610 [Actinobacteria bacterium]|nr:hypothetical protein [Actinomycetota bacterium]
MLLRIETENSSTYLVSSAPDGRRVRVTRVSDHPVRGTAGPMAFVADFDRVEIVPGSVGLRLHCHSFDGPGFTTSPIVSVREESLWEAVAS